MFSRRSALLALVLLGLGTYAPFLGRTDLTSPDEPRYALVAREMFETGNWLRPQLAGEPYAQKPPLFLWAIAATAQAWGGVDEVSARIPSVLSAVGLLLLTFALARRLFPRAEGGTRLGLLAAGILGTNFRFLVLACRANIDCMLAFWTTAAFLAFLRGFPLDRAAARAAGPDADGTRPGWLLAAFALAGLSVLTKGVGGLLFLLGLLAYLALARDRLAWREVPWFAGVLVLAAVAILWVGPAAIIGGEEYGHDLVVRQTVRRALDPWAHLHPAWYYAKTLPVNFLPWTVCVPVAAFELVRAWTRRTALAETERRGLTFALAVCGVIVVFFTLLPSKRDYYLLPALPWLSLGVAWGVDRALGPAGASRGATPGYVATAWTLIGAGALAGAGLVAWGAVPRDLLPHLARVDAPDFVRDALVAPFAAIGVLLLAGLAVAAVLLARGRPWPSWCALLLTVVAGWGVYHGAVRPAYNPIRSARVLAERLAARATPHDLIVTLCPTELSLVFYSHCRIFEWFDRADELALHDVLARPQRIYLIATVKGLAAIETRWPDLRLARLEEGWVEEEPSVLVVNGR